MTSNIPLEFALQQVNFDVVTFKLTSLYFRGKAGASMCDIPALQNKEIYKVDHIHYYYRQLELHHKAQWPTPRCTICVYISFLACWACVGRLSTDVLKQEADGSAHTLSSLCLFRTFSKGQMKRRSHIRIILSSQISLVMRAPFLIMTWDEADIYLREIGCFIWHFCTFNCNFGYVKSAF